MSPLLLDLFCGGGGASAGYRNAGFDVIAVDIADRSRAMGRLGIPFARCDWAEGLERFGRLADVIHASPPCQRYSRASACRPGLAATYPDLVGPVRDALIAAGKPWVIENVPGAPLAGPVQVCGTSFDLTAGFGPQKVELRRHRLFESNTVLAGAPCRHELTAIRVFGHGRPGNSGLRGPGYARATREAMGIGWMSRDELNEAIPPAFAEYIGRQLLPALNHGETP